jgi:endonuclease/exonuclease/phosphatase family metal-dependent hydrolase
VLSASLLCAGPTLAAETLKVMSLNVRTPVDRDDDKRWEIRRAAMVKLLREQRPAVIGTQELVREQGNYLTTQLPAYRWFGASRSGADSDEHMGVLYDHTRLRLIQSGDFWLSDTPEVTGSISWGNLLPRMVTWAQFERRGDQRRFYLFNTHLPYRQQDDVARERAAKLILQRLQQLPAGVPVVLTGDFNTVPGSAPYRTLITHLSDSRELARENHGPAATFHNFTGKPLLQLDWILVSGFQVERFTTLDQRHDGVLPSDHFPIQAELRWAD